MRNERKTLHHQMSFALKEIKKHLPQFIYSIFFQCLILLLLRYIPARRVKGAEWKRISCCIIPHPLLRSLSFIALTGENTSVWYFRTSVWRNISSLCPTLLPLQKLLSRKDSESGDGDKINRRQNILHKCSEYCRHTKASFVTVYAFCSCAIGIPPPFRHSYIRRYRRLYHTPPKMCK